MLGVVSYTLRDMSAPGTSEGISCKNKVLRDGAADIRTVRSWSFPCPYHMLHTTLLLSDACQGIRTCVAKYRQDMDLVRGRLNPFHTSKPYNLQPCGF